MKDRDFERPLFIVSPPRSGSTLLFETLARAPGRFTIGGESHHLIESVPGLGVGAHNSSNRLDARAATPDIVQSLRQRFFAQLRDRDGQPPRTSPVRMLEKTPKNALRAPFLRQIFPEARFVCLHRDVRQTMSSMLEAWRSGRFKTYAGLPDWTGPSWSLLLIPGWRSLIGKPLVEIVAAQWAATVNTMLDDLEQMPRAHVTVCRYEAFVADWGGEIAKLAAWAELAWDAPTTTALPLSRHTLTAPDRDKWRANAEEIEPQLARLEDTIARAERFVAAG